MSSLDRQRALEKEEQTDLLWPSTLQVPQASIVAQYIHLQSKWPTHSMNDTRSAASFQTAEEGLAIPVDAKSFGTFLVFFFY